jgi:hypothetical protein
VHALHKPSQEVAETHGDDSIASRNQIASFHLGVGIVRALRKIQIGDDPRQRNLFRQEIYPWISIRLCLAIKVSINPFMRR